MSSRSVEGVNEATEREMMEAIDRLVAGSPRAAVLAERAAVGELRVDKKAVAIEAGRSRTTLYKYPRVVARIEALMNPPATTTKGVVAALREENAVLRDDRRKALDAAAAMLLRMRELERGTEAAIRRAERAARRGDPMRVVGVDNVVPLHGDEDAS
jgi:hypothetical protein